MIVGKSFTTVNKLVISINHQSLSYRKNQNSLVEKFNEHYVYKQINNLYDIIMK